MAKEDLLLREEMGRLEIDPIKVKENKNENPFNVQAKRRMHAIHCVHTVACACTHHKKYKNAGISKKKSNKLLKEPVLQVIKSYVSLSNQDKESQPKCSSTLDGNTDSLNLCTLVTTCNQLKISNDSKEKIVSTSSNENKWWSKAKSTSDVRENRELRQHSQTGSCSQQALNPPCDVTIDELASYFETLVHIPKKMSSMAEMMYI